jgi:Ras-related protein Rab-2A
MNDLIFMECSAKSGYNVDYIFESLSTAVLEKVGKGEIDTSDESGGVKIGEYEPMNPQIKGRNCC